MEEWRELMTKLRNVQLIDEEDRVVWKLEQLGSVYLFVIIYVKLVSPG
jgi:hypothetical protein